MKKFVVLAASLLFMCVSSAGAEKTGIDKSLLEEAKAGLRKGCDYLLSKANYDKKKDLYSWGPYGGHPAITSLVATALITSPYAKEKKYAEVIDKSLKYIASFAQKDGSIWQKEKKQYPNYTTSTSLIALYASGKKEYIPICKKARAFIKKSQFTEGTNFGGIGYGSKKHISDLSNTQMALEALHLTESLEDDGASEEEKKSTKLCWDRAKKFLTRCQQTKMNDLEWAKKNKKKSDHGGAVYSPETSKSLHEDGSLRTYGSMTYALLKSMIYAKLKPDDVRVVAAMGWASRHYTLDENPGMKKQGHYYYLHTFSKAMHVTGKHVLVDKDGKKHFWRKDVILKLLSLQKGDGSWINSEGRWQESVPELAGAFALLSMQYALAHEKLD